MSNSEADTWTWLARPRVLRDLTAGLGLRLEAVSGHEEAVEDCDMTEDEAEGGVRASCFPARLKMLQRFWIFRRITFRNELLRLLRCHRRPRKLFPRNGRNDLGLGILRMIRP